MAEVLKIGNASAFWGDRPDAPEQLLSRQPDLDYLTLDYLAEVSLSILAIQSARDPSAGYARDFLDVVRSLAPRWKSGSKTKLVTNAGGLNPEGCARACREVLRESGCDRLSVYVVTGDDVLPLIKSSPREKSFSNLETGESITDILDRVVAANVYLGAKPVAEALKAGADIVITGRVTDPALTVGPCVAHFGWSWEDYDRIAGATTADATSRSGRNDAAAVWTRS